MSTLWKGEKNMEDNIVIFKPNGEEHIIEIRHINGEAWATAQEIGEALGHSNIHNLIRDMKNAGELKEGIHISKVTLDMVGDKQPRKYLLLSYRGIIRVSMRTETAVAIKFRDWAEDVLYAVMTTGSYSLREVDKTDKSRYILDHAREMERIDRVFGAYKRMAVKIGLTGHGAIRKANEMTVDSIGINVLEMFNMGYLAEIQNLDAFIGEKCVFDPELMILPADLFGAYVKWCADTKRQPIGKLSFYRQIYTEYPQIGKRRHETREYLFGIGLQTVEQAVEVQDE